MGIIASGDNIQKSLEDAYVAYIDAEKQKHGIKGKSISTDKEGKSDLDKDIDVASATTLIVGKNNTGKTSVIQAPVIEFVITIALEKDSDDLVTNLVPFMLLGDVEREEIEIVIKYEISEKDKFKEAVLKACKQVEEKEKRSNEKVSGNRTRTDFQMYNRDRLDKMRISHDTLLEYGKKLILKHSVLQQIIFDQFPYIFIDEYQDTSSEVVEIMAALDTHAKEIEHKFFVGYYGDRVQNIYDNGIGCHLLEKHENLERISKEFNWRSYKEIIDVANRIRFDDLHQISIYKDCIGGNVEFCDVASVETVIERYRNEENDIIGEKVHCFVLKNEEVAKRLGISNLYNVFKNSRAYSNARFQQLNTELLSTDKEKLGEAASFLYRVLEFYTDVRWEGTPVEKILYGDIKDYHNLNIAELKSIKKCLQGIEGDTLEMFLKKMCKCYKKGNNNIRTIIKAVLDLDEITDNYITGYFMQTLEQKNLQENEGEEDDNESVGKIRQLYSIRMEELEKWFDYVKRKEKTDVVYHTFHGTKGPEFENVIIVLEDGFGTKTEDKVFIKNFLENYSELNSEKQILIHEKARNLLYVAVTRAKKRLKIIYTGDSTKVKETLVSIFNQNKIKEYNFIN